MNNTNTLTRAQRIALLKRIIAGEATPEALRPRRMVHKIYGARSGKVTGLYVNDELTTDPTDHAEFWNALANRKIIVRRMNDDGE